MASKVVLGILHVLRSGSMEANFRGDPVHLPIVASPGVINPLLETIVNIQLQLSARFLLSLYVAAAGTDSRII